jgi:hypothetical protein
MEFGPEFSQEVPGTLKREAFFSAATDPDAMPDVMDFHLRAMNLDRTRGFSVEGFEAVGYQMHDWLMARTLAYFRRHGEFPVGVRAEVRLVWDDDRDAEALKDESTRPWYLPFDREGEPVELDGTHRFSTFLADRRGGG